MIALSSLLIDAVNFLFGEGKRILQERRERLGLKIDTPVPAPERQAITSKEAALNQEVPQIAWNNSEAKIKHLMALLKIHTQNYYLAKEQYGKWGSALVPPIIVNNLSEAENAVATTIKELEDEMSKIYGKKIVVPEV
jgi:hypothetical protein